MSDEAAIEKEIQDKGLNAPRITPETIDDQIIAEAYWNPGRDPATGVVGPGAEERHYACLTVCALLLKNGFTVVGKSACASLENFDLELGRKIAKADARQQIWALEGYQLRTELAKATTAA